MEINNNLSEYEMNLARAIAVRPDLVCLDTRLFFSKGIWLDKPEYEEFEYSETTYRVVVVFTGLYSEEERKKFGRNFRIEKAFNVYTEEATNVPTFNDFFVPSFPIGEDDIIDVCRKFLSATEYAKDNNEFLFGSKIYKIEERG